GPLLEMNGVLVFHEPAIDGRERGDTREDPPAAVVDDDDLEAELGRKLRHDPRRVHVVDRGEIADDADVRARGLALPEEGGELAVDAVRASVGLDGEAARFARRGEVPLADRERIAEVDARALLDPLR